MFVDYLKTLFLVLVTDIVKNVFKKSYFTSDESFWMLNSELLLSSILWL